MTYEVNYIQQIRFVTPGCNAGNCQSDPASVYVDSVYGPSRKGLAGTERVRDLRMPGNLCAPSAHAPSACP
jgi:hypothetical protein